MADLDQDGFAEVIWRNHVFDHEGHLKWAGTKRSGSAGHGALSVAVDLNGDGKHTVADISIFLLNLSSDNPRFDFNLDGEVGAKDLSVIMNAK